MRQETNTNVSQQTVRWNSSRDRQSQPRKQAGFRHIGQTEQKKEQPQAKPPRFSFKGILKNRTVLARAGVLTLLIALLLGAAWFSRSLDEGTLDSGAMASAMRDLQPSPTAPPAPSAAVAAAPTVKPANGTPDYFANFRADRTRIREKELALLDEVIAAGGEAAEEAAEQKVELTTHMEAEFSIEQTLLAKGYADAVCIARDDSATVAIKKAPLSESDTAIILSVAMGATDLDADEIKVVAVP